MRFLRNSAHRLFNSLGFDIHKIEPRTRADARKLALPSLAITAVLNEKVPVRIMEPESANGNITLLELLVLNSLVARLSPNALFEIGTFDGRTTLNLACNAAPDARTFTLDLPRHELPGTAYALDSYEKGYTDKPAPGQRFHHTRWQEQIVQLLGDSAKFDFQPYHGKMGFVFIDGSHAYDYVKNDTQAALHLVSSPAFIVWHDYQPFWEGVVKHLEELYSQGGLFAGLRRVEGTTLAVLPVGTSL